MPTSSLWCNGRMTFLGLFYVTIQSLKCLKNGTLSGSLSVDDLWTVMGCLRAAILEGISQVPIVFQWSLGLVSWRGWGVWQASPHSHFFFQRKKKNLYLKFYSRVRRSWITLWWLDSTFLSTISAGYASLSALGNDGERLSQAKQKKKSKNQNSRGWITGYHERQYKINSFIVKSWIVKHKKVLYNPYWINNKFRIHS